MECKHEWVTLKYEKGKRSMSRTACFQCFKTTDEIELMQDVVAQDMLLNEAKMGADLLESRLTTLTAQLAAAERVANATQLYLKHINSPLCIGWDDLLDALAAWQKVRQ